MSTYFRTRHLKKKRRAIALLFLLITDNRSLITIFFYSFIASGDVLSVDFFFAFRPAFLYAMPL
jgi:hypothetical protein